METIIKEEYEGYYHTHPLFPTVEALFNNEGYTIDVELGNDLIIEKEGEYIHYDNLPAHLKSELEKIYYTYNL